LRFLCLRIFFRRFLITLPKGCPSLNGPRDGGREWLVADRFEVNCAGRRGRCGSRELARFENCVFSAESQTFFALDPVPGPQFEIASY